MENSGSQRHFEIKAKLDRNVEFPDNRHGFTSQADMPIPTGYEANHKPDK
jgi:hypothetical protein